MLSLPVDLFANAPRCVKAATTFAGVVRHMRLTSARLKSLSFSGIDFRYPGSIHQIPLFRCGIYIAYSRFDTASGYVSTKAAIGRHSDLRTDRSRRASSNFNQSR